jgi:hypothetical protein
MCSLKCPSLDADRGVVVQGHLREKLSSESSAFIAWDKFKISWEILRRECVFCETGAGVLSKSLIIQVSLIQEQALNTACQSGPFACSLIAYDSCRHEQDLDLFELRAWPWCRWSIDQYRWDMIIHDQHLLDVWCVLWISWYLYVWFVLNNSCAAAPTIHLTTLTFSSPDVGRDSFQNVKCRRKGWTNSCVTLLRGLQFKVSAKLPAWMTYRGETMAWLWTATLAPSLSWGNHRKAIANQCPCGPVDPLQRAWALSRVALCRRVLRPRETHWPRGPGVKTGLPVSPTRRTRTTWGMAPTTHYQLPSGRRMRAMLSGIASWVQPLWLNPNLKDECGCILWIRRQ